MEEAVQGTAFFIDDFLDLGMPDNIRQALVRLNKKGSIRKAAQGIYYIPKPDKWDGSPLPISLDEVAKAVAEKSKTRVVPTGAYSLNILGLTTQVPATATYMTDGAPRKIKTATGAVIEFRHTSDMTWFSYKSDIMLLVVAAMREIGENEITTSELDIIKNHIARVATTDYEHDIKLAPVWILKKLSK